MFENILFTDLTRRYVFLIHLTLLDDFDKILIYSSGFVVLVYMYRHICLACMKVAK